MSDRHRPHLIRLFAALAGLLLVAGCGLGPAATKGPTPVPTTSASPSPSVSPSSAPSGAACTLPPPGPLASDTLMDAKLVAGPTSDRLVFTFGTRPPEAIAQPSVGIGFADPPFSMAGSGEAVVVPGDRHLKVRMDGMVVAHPDGAPVYDGERVLTLSGGSIPGATMTDEFEGVVTWIVGLSGSGCPTITPSTSGPTQLVIELAR